MQKNLYTPPKNKITTAADQWLLNAYN